MMTFVEHADLHDQFKRHAEVIFNAMVATGAVSAVNGKSPTSYTGVTFDEIDYETATSYHAPNLNTVVLSGGDWSGDEYVVFRIKVKMHWLDLHPDQAVAIATEEGNKIVSEYFEKRFQEARVADDEAREVRRKQWEVLNKEFGQQNS